MLDHSENGRSGKSTFPFLLDEERLKAFRDIFVTSGDALSVPYWIRYSMRRIDTQRHTTVELREILRDTNSKGREISSLTIEMVVKGRRDEPSPEQVAVDAVIASVAFVSTQSALEQISEIAYTIDYKDRSWCSELGAEIKEQLDRLGSSRPARVPPWLGTAVAFSIWMLVLIAFYTFVVAPASISPIDQIAYQKLGVNAKLDRLYTFQQWLYTRNGNYEAFYFFTIVLLAIAILCHSIKPLTRLKGTMERSYFLWGDQVEVYRMHERRVRQKAQAVRNAFVIVGTAVVATLVAEPVVVLIRGLMKWRHLM